MPAQERWIGIGPVKDIPLKRARELHAENRQMVAERADPRDHRRYLQAAAAAAVQAAKIVTFEQMGDRFIDSHEAGWKNAKHRQQWRRTLKSYVYPHIGALPLSTLDTALAMRVFQQPLEGTTFWLARPETASRTRGRCEQIWDAAKAQKLCSGENQRGMLARGREFDVANAR